MFGDNVQTPTVEDFEEAHAHAEHAEHEAQLQASGRHAAAEDDQQLQH